MLSKRHRSALRCFFLQTYILFNISGVALLHAEGTKEIKPSIGNYGDLKLQSVVSPGAEFASYGGPEYERLHVHICKTGEVIHIGFQSRNNNYYRLIAPDGSTALAERRMSVAPGVIPDYAAAVAGSASGAYTPVTHTALQTGDYYIEIRGNQDVAFFDIAVTDGGQIKTGRLWSKAWLMTTGSAANAYSGLMYVYTNDKVTTKINFNGIQPFEFIVSANGTGTGNTGNFVQDRRSVTRNSTRPDYKIFLNPPDTLCFDTGVLGEVLNQPTITGCPGNYCINIEVTAPGFVVFNIDVNGIPDIQLGTSDRVIQQQVLAGKNCVKWDGKDGLGNDISSSASVDINVQYSNGLTNLPMFDAEYHRNGYIVTYVRPIPTGMSASTPIPLYWDDSSIREGTAPDGKTNLVTGCVSAQGCHKWLTRGTQSSGNDNHCPPLSGDVECPQTINTWWVVKEQILKVAHSLYKKDIDANRRDPKKGKWNDTLVCASDLSLRLNGIVTGARGIKWNILKGTGSIANDTLRSTVYTFDPNDKKITNVIFLISSTGDTCPPALDTMKVFFDPVKSLTIAPPAEICAATPTPISLSPQLSNTANMTWTGGAGTFSPNRTSANVKYTPTAQELAAGSVKLIANTNDVVVSCPNTKDSVVLLMKMPPAIQAPRDTSFCTGASNIKVDFTALHSRADSIQWLVNNSALFTFDKDTGAHITGRVTQMNQEIILKVEAHKAGCPKATDSLRIVLSAAPSLKALVNPTCDTDQRINLSGSATQALPTDLFAWSPRRSKGTYVQDSTLLNNTYIPTVQERSQGWAEVTLMHATVTSCPAKDTLVRIRLIPLPSSNAGRDSLVCRGTQIVQRTLTNNAWSYEWRTNPDTNSAPLSSTSQLQVTVVSDTNVYLLVKNSQGCSTLDSAQIKVFDPPVINLAPHLCLYNNTAVMATVSNRPPLGKYSWSKDQKPLTDTAASLTVSAPGRYVYSYSYAHCKHSDTLLATVPPLAHAPGIMVCANTSSQLKADSVYKATYIWNGTASSSNQYPVVATLGKNLVNLKVRDSYGCVDSTQVQVEGVPAPEFTLSPQNICEGLKGKVLASLKDPSLASSYPIKHQWLADNKAINTLTWKEVSFATPGTYKLTLKIGDCRAEQSTTTVVYPKPKLDIPREHKYCYEDGAPIQLTSPTFTKHLWYGKDGLIDTAKAIFVRPIVKSEYTLKVENSYGCRDSLPVEVRVSCPPRLHVPNVITPESKDVNATLNVYGAFYTDFELTVFNRWGEIIYETRDPKAPWDGTYRGEPMPIGVYPWIIRYNAEYEEYKKPLKYQQQGDVTIVR